MSSSVSIIFDLWTLISDVQFSEICWKAADSWFTCVFNSWNQDDCYLTTGHPDLDWSLDWSTDLGDIDWLIDWLFNWSLWQWLIDCSPLWGCWWSSMYPTPQCSGWTGYDGNYNLSRIFKKNLNGIWWYLSFVENIFSKTWTGCTAQWTVAKDSTPSKPCRKN